MFSFDIFKDYFKNSRVYKILSSTSLVIYLIKNTRISEPDL